MTDPADIAELAAMLDGTEIAELSLTEAGETITLRRHRQPPPADSLGPFDGPDSAQPTPVSTKAGKAESVIAPCPGIFLTRHPLHDDDLASPGPVAAGAVVGLLRLGPLLGPVTPPQAGLLSGPEATAGSLVGYGTILFRLHPEA